MSSCGLCTVPGTNGFIHSPPIHTDKVNYHLSPTPSMTLISLRLALGLPVYILNLQPLPFTHMTYINDVHGIHAVACNGKGFQHQSSWLSLSITSFIVSLLESKERGERSTIYIYIRDDDPQWKFHTISHQSGDSIKRELVYIVIWILNIFSGSYNFQVREWDKNRF
jgi:hypothetical protein